jgi:protein-S-isoprenylcysteine O-methyltransferase Ste14
VASDARPAPRRPAICDDPLVPRPHYLIFGVVSYLVAIRSMVYLVPFLANRGVSKTIDSGAPGATATALGVDLALLLAFAVTHSALARRPAKEWLRRTLPACLETSAFSLVAGVQMTCLLVLWMPLPTPVWQIRDAAGRASAWSLFLLGWGVVLIGFATLRNSRLFGLEQAWAGARGREPEPPSLRRVGIYRLLRHPLYAGTILALWATPEMSAGHFLLASVFTGYIVVGRHFEERDLERVHGEAWRRYRDAVPAFLPRLWRTGSPPAARE